MTKSLCVRVVRHAPRVRRRDGNTVEDPGGDDLLVVASRALVAGDAITRDYGRAPSLSFIDGSDADPGSESDVLRRLLQFGQLSAAVLPGGDHPSLGSYVGKADKPSRRRAAAGASETAASPADGACSPPSAAPVAVSGTETPPPPPADTGSQWSPAAGSAGFAGDFSAASAGALSAVSAAGGAAADLFRWSGLLRRFRWPGSGRWLGLWRLRGSRAPGPPWPATPAPRSARRAPSPAT